jgi:peptidoglycan-associated lipoprotein
MKKHVMRYLTVAMILIVATALALSGCKKKMPKEEAPPPPPPTVQPVTPLAESDTTGDAAKREASLIDADKSRMQVVLFDYDRSDVRPDQREKIKTNTEILRKWPSWNVSVEGHCDERGTNEYNFALGERRAKAVVKALTSEGIETGRIATISYGEERPADPGHSESSWTRNRRAECKIK